VVWYAASVSLGGSVDGGANRFDSSSNPTPAPTIFLDCWRSCGFRFKYVFLKSCSCGWGLTGSIITNRKCNDAISPANTQSSDFGLPTWHLGLPNDLFLQFSSVFSTFTARRSDHLGPTNVQLQSPDSSASVRCAVVWYATPSRKATSRREAELLGIDDTN
jgi:hypothetical protein